jgi:hypothetical protein
MVAALTGQHAKALYVVGRDAKRRARVERLPVGLRGRVYERQDATLAPR